MSFETPKDQWSEMIAAQNAENAIRASLTPEENARRSYLQLLQIAEIEPGLRYLFADG